MIIPTLPHDTSSSAGSPAIDRRLNVLRAHIGNIRYACDWAEPMADRLRACEREADAAMHELDTLIADLRAGTLD